MATPKDEKQDSPIQPPKPDPEQNNGPLGKDDALLAGDVVPFNGQKVKDMKYFGIDIKPMPGAPPGSSPVRDMQEQLLKSLQRVELTDPVGRGEPGAERHAFADPSNPNRPLFDAIRAKLPAEIGDDKAAEATLQAMKNDIRTPNQLNSVNVQDGRIHVGGTTPGFRAQVELDAPAPPVKEVESQASALNQAQDVDAPAKTQGVRTLT